MTLKSDSKFEEKLTWRLEGFGKFLLEPSKTLKLTLWWNVFIQSRECISLKFTEELCIMTMKNDAKFEKELTCCFKVNTTTWRIFTWALECLPNMHFNVTFWSKYMFGVKTYRKVIFDGTKDCCKIWKKNWKAISTKCSEKFLLYLGNNWIAQLTKLFTHVLQNRCS